MTPAGLPSIPSASSADAKLNQTSSPRDPSNGDKKSGDEAKRSPIANAWQAVFMALLPIPLPRGAITANGKAAPKAPSAVSPDATPKADMRLSSKSKTSANQDRSGSTSATSFPDAGESVANVPPSPIPTGAQAEHRAASSPSQSLPTHAPVVPGQSNSSQPVNETLPFASVPLAESAKSAKPISKLGGGRSRQGSVGPPDPATSAHVGQTPQPEDGGHLSIVPSKTAASVTTIASKNQELLSGSDNGKKQPSSTVPETLHPSSLSANSTPFSLTIGAVRFSPGSPDAIPNLMNNLPFSTIHQALAQGTLASPGMVFVLHLNPPELGQIALKITASADQRIHLHFKVDDLAVKQVLSAGWNHLQSSLIAHGLAPDGLTVDLHSTTTAGSFFGQASGDRPTSQGGQATGLSILASTPSQEDQANEPSPSQHLVDYIL